SAAPAPGLATAPTDGDSDEDEDVDEEVLGEVEDAGDLLAPSKLNAAGASAKAFTPPVREDAEEGDALAAAAKAAEVAASKPRKPGESFSGGATELDLEDPIAALERL